jgi:hypothetical protein
MNIAPHHLNRFVAGLVHDAALAGAVARRLRGKPAGQAVRAKTRGIESSGFAPTLHHQSDDLCGNGASSDEAMTVDGSKDGAGGEPETSSQRRYARTGEELMLPTPTCGIRRQSRSVIARGRGRKYRCLRATNAVE